MPEYLDFILRLGLFCLLHSLLAAPRFKRYLQQKTGTPLRGYRLAYNLIACLSFFWVMLAWQSTQVIFVAPGIWSLIMSGLQLVVLVLAVNCLRQTGIASFLGTDLKYSDDHDTLITSGCYSFVRHPLYLLGILFLVLMPVVTTRWIVLSGFSSAYFLLGALIEEQRMLRKYGRRYAIYQQQVPFLIPGSGTRYKAEESPR